MWGVCMQSLCVQSACMQSVCMQSVPTKTKEFVGMKLKQEKEEGNTHYTLYNRWCSAAEHTASNAPFPPLFSPPPFE